MRAFSTANGGVMFIPDEIERIEKTVSYNELVEAAPAKKPTFISRVLGQSKDDEKEIREAA